MLISKALGYVVILGSVAVKLPQIFRLVDAKSAAGISFSMFLLEVVGYSINLAYNYQRGNPFSTWGENFFLLVQTIVILALMFHYSGGISAKVGVLGAVWALALSTLLSGQVPLEVMTILQTGSVAVFIASKVPQVYSNFAHRSTGKLAFLTFFLNFAGSAARVFTTISEIDDNIILASAILGAVLNLTITLQILIFGDKEAKGATQSSQRSNVGGTVTPLGKRGATSDESDDDELSGSDEGETPGAPGEASPRSLEDSSGSSSGSKSKTSIKSLLKKKSQKNASPVTNNKTTTSPPPEEEEEAKKKDKKDKKEKEKKDKEEKKAAEKQKKEQEKAAKKVEEQEKAAKKAAEKASATKK